jgi:Cytochrome c7 and related cytochrome c
MRRLDALLATGLVVAAACGGAGAGGPGPQGPTGGGLPAESGGAAPVPSAPDGGTGTPTTTTAPAPTTPVGPEHLEMKAPVPTTMVADLAALGIDAKNLPPLAKLDPKALRGVMKLLAKSLGGKCGDCHLEGDFAAPTRRKKIATKMWDEWAVKLTLADGSPLFCDSCHQGRIVQLDRTDKKALGKWMDASFVDGLKSKDGKTLECETCHVDMEMKFLSIWAR